MPFSLFFMPVCERRKRKEVSRRQETSSLDLSVSVVADFFYIRLQNRFVQVENILFRYRTRVARSANVCYSLFGKSRNVLFLDAQFGQMLRNAHEFRQVLYFVASGFCCLFVGHACLINTYRLCYLHILLDAHRHIKAHYRREQNGTSHTVWYIVQGTHRMSHAVVYT